MARYKGKDWARDRYTEQRVRDILDAVQELPAEANADWLSAAARLREKVEGLTIAAALELLVTVYASDDQIPCQNLPKGT